VSEKKIIQIMPAEGWRALYFHRGDAGEVVFEEEPLVCWALMEESTENIDETVRSVEGLSADSWVETVEHVSNFLAYLAPGESPEKFHDEAERRLRKSEEE
jgi:hypothetical protein